ncbi:PepSY-associated TM helix domain-containing protein [Gluconobacter kanchanaburiensis]|uniref:PepSY-associated TM helix domain-containing protein n=1 Tax=Gluconobacter kanchanaburiensis TaxID=563199 RepID=UPI0011BD9220|nr:PepSY-associated TM helix domain-containing protein [Gluconobacter kanchanaburiensis]MBF0863065.1 PepSY domain-containing protein [Gluconobacter kanchanaburiensis]
MDQNFRRSMGWMHTWAGVVLGSILFAIFWMGTLSVFDSEIDSWMEPATRLPAATSPLPLETFRPSLNDAITAKAAFWNVIMPDDRQAVVHVHYRTRQKFITREFDPVTGKELPNSGTLGATGFIFPFHYTLEIRLMNIGEWVVGLASMSMLALCVTGIIIHRKIFSEFFTFRPNKNSKRLLLDIHNMAGVLGLPFHIILTFSGLIILSATFFPSNVKAVYPNPRDYFFEVNGLTFLPIKSGKTGAPVASLDKAALFARKVWAGAEPHTILVVNPGTTTSRMAFFRECDRQVVVDRDVISFEGPTGKYFSRSPTPHLIIRAERFLSGLHLIQFHHWALRWFYFILGLGSCVLIGTGFLFWLETRRKTQNNTFGFRIVEGLTSGSVTGIIIATLIFFVANRLLPPDAYLFGHDRATLEVWSFYLSWLATFLHGWMRPRQMWIEQSTTIGVLALLAALLNWITTGDHPLRTLFHRYLWPVAGMDGVLVVGAALALITSMRLSRRARLPNTLRIPSGEHL